MPHNRVPDPKSFARLLTEWYDGISRDLPWRRTSDPYAIWVSEIMLQQTRVAAVIPYYERFLQRFPDVSALAGASEADLLAAWAGLGYYSRVRNMQKAARQTEGSFPKDYHGIRNLSGIGDYTAAAVASIAFDLPHAAVDGNVLRVLSRVTADAGDITTPAVKRRLQGVADRLLDREQPGKFNQAMMELGATVCLPRGEPECLLCPVAELCAARAEGRQAELPVKSRKAEIIRMERTVYLLRRGGERGGELLFWQRPPDSRKLAGFWELPEAEHLAAETQSLPTVRIGSFRHSITNHDYTFQVEVAEMPDALLSPCKNVVKTAWMSCKPPEDVAISTTARKALGLLTE